MSDESGYCLFNETPTIDALARQGMRFTQAYAAEPVCSPNRAGLMTGLYPARTGITDFLRGEPAASYRYLSTDFVTIPEALRPLGYASGLIGKWHLTEDYSGEYEDRPGNPFAHGFDEVIASEQLYIADGDYFHPYFFMPDLPARTEGEYLTDRLTLPYEPSLRTPLLIRGPGIPAGGSRTAPFLSIDFAPTIMDVANAQPPNSIDGKSLLSVAKVGGSGWVRPVLTEPAHERPSPKPTTRVPRSTSNRRPHLRSHTPSESGPSGTSTSNTYPARPSSTTCATTPNNSATPQTWNATHSHNNG
jgi:arylsulfatase A-like enzyme